MEPVNRPGAGEVILELTADVPGRIDTIVANALPGHTRGRVQKLIDAGLVTLNGEPVRKSGQLKIGDHVVVREFEAVAVAIAPAFDLPVLFEDEWLAVIDKPAGLAVHGAPGDTEPGVAGWWLARLGAIASTFAVERPGIVHRLDKDTTGVLVLAKTPATQAALSKAFEERTTSKTYIAVCDGVPPRERAVIDAPLGRHPGDRTKMAIVRSGGRDARTEYEVIASARGKAVVRIKPETGRTHQIRVHLAAIHAPVRFDRVYGLEGEGRQMLHAWRLSIPHPAGGTLTVTAPLPADIAEEVRAVAGDSIALEFTRPSPPEWDRPAS